MSFHQYTTNLLLFQLGVSSADAQDASPADSRRARQWPVARVVRRTTHRPWSLVLPRPQIGQTNY